MWRVSRGDLWWGRREFRKERKERGKGREEGRQGEVGGTKGKEREDLTAGEVWRAVGGRENWWSSRLEWDNGAVLGTRRKSGWSVGWGNRDGISGGRFWLEWREGCVEILCGVWAKGGGEGKTREERGMFCRALSGGASWEGVGGVNSGGGRFEKWRWRSEVLAGVDGRLRWRGQR